MSGDDCNTLFSHQAQLEAKRANWDVWWQAITERVLPSQAQITVTNEQGLKRTERLFDSRAVFANERFAAVMNDLLTPQTQRYHVLLPDTGSDETSQESKVHLERINDALFRERYRPAANFASQKSEGYMSVGAIGNSCLFMPEDVGVGCSYIGVHMREVFWAINDKGLIDTLYRRFDMGAAAAVKFFARMGVELAETIRKCAETSPWQDFTFLHCVRPNDDRIAGRCDYRGMPWSSYYASYEGRKMLSSGGFNEWPYALGRYHVGTREWYARSPAMTAWPAICTINEEKKTILRAGQLGVAPPILLTEDGALDGFNMKSLALNYGALSDEGIELVKPLKIGENVPLGMELMELEGRDIDEAFLATIYKALLEHPTMTATQALQLIQEKAVLLAPIGVRHEAEDMGPMITRELGCLTRQSKYAWIVEEMPDELREQNGGFKIESRSPLARALRSGDAIAISRTWEAMTTAAQVDPNVSAVIDVPGSFREFAEITGMPAKYIRDDKTVQAMLANKEAQEQAANVASVAPEMAQAALNISKAQQIRTTTPGV